MGLNQDVSTLNKTDIGAGTSDASAKGEVSQINETGTTSVNASLYGDGSGLKTIEAGSRQELNNRRCF